MSISKVLNQNIERAKQLNHNVTVAVVMTIIGFLIGCLIAGSVIGGAGIFVLNGLFQLGLEYNLYNFSIVTVAWVWLRGIFKR